MSPAPKKGLSIGAAMKQRMGQEQTERPAEGQERKEERKLSFTEGQGSVTPERAPELSDKFLWQEGDLVIQRREEADPLESFNTRLPRSLLRRLKVHAAQEGVKIQDVLREALEAHLSK
ncbi:hypothetical protein [Deinococcus sp. PESE-13]